ncbi:hypothetical protein QFC21_007073 [Naganishia friedmannii]|uniref:Uncharacterized protein n=1 Tax=Naganishia friedmannii TaxID=89922 RepID=A0ACC2UYY0_9TREE|nr:hypothetical protein QFC21_007073 [Naganishia friedmannii]
MPDIKLDNQPFDLAFHPSEPFVYTSLLTGEIKAFKYADDTNASTGEPSHEPEEVWSARPTKKCMRSLMVQSDGTRVWGCATGKLVEERPEAHGSAVNRIANCFGNLLATGDDDGLIKLWDQRQKEAVREYNHHWEYISDFVFLDDKKQLVSTSGDGTVSVIDVRSNSTTPFAVSDDQEDELLSIVTIKGGAKHVVGTQLGVLSVFERQKGWKDSVDRILGHPASVEAMVALTDDIVATGSEDGMIRVMQVHPNKFLGVIATHGDFPIERMRIDRNSKWLGSVSHDDTLKLTDVSDLFEESDNEEDGERENQDDENDDTASQTTEKAVADESGDDSDADSDAEMTGAEGADGEVDGDGDTAMEDTQDDSDSDSDAAEDRKAARKAAQRQKRKEREMERKSGGLSGKGLLIPKEDKKKESQGGGGFFDDLPPVSEISSSIGQLEIEAQAINLSDKGIRTLDLNYKISESAQPKAQNQPQGLRRRRSDSGEAGSEHALERKRAKIDQTIINSPTRTMNGNGGSTSTGGGGSSGPGASLSARIRRVDFPSEWMYMEDAVKAGYTPDGNQEQDQGKGKGKGRAFDASGSEMGNTHSASSTKPATSESLMPVRREEFVRLVLQALREVGYSQTAEVLRAESGYEEENQTATALRNAILGGRWSESITLLEELGVVLPGDRLPLRRNKSFGSEAGRHNSNTSTATTPAATPTAVNPVVVGPSSSSAGRTEVSMLGSVPSSLSVTNGFGQGGLTPSTSFETGGFGALGPSTTSTLGTPSSERIAGAIQSLDVNSSDAFHSASGWSVEPSPEDSVGRQAIFKIYEQKYLELLELDQQNRALSVLRHQLAPIAAESDKLHALSRCLFKGKAALHEERGWDGARGNSRINLLYHLQDLVPSGIILPPKRLATLFDQARKHQQLECSYHNNEPAMSLLSDHSCKRGSFPSVPTYVLNEHTDEVWVLEWSHDGRFLATGGRDGQVVIWEVGPAPLRKCEKIASLSGHKDPISAIAYSPDDSRLVVACESTFYLWDTKSGSLVLTQNTAHKDMITAIIWLPERQGFVTSSHDMSLIYWTWHGTLRSSIDTHPLRIESLLVCPQRNRLVAAGFVFLPEKGPGVTSPTASRTPDQKPPPINGHEPENLSLSSEFEKMQRVLIVYDLNKPGLEKSRKVVPGEVTCMSSSPDEKQILLSFSTSELQLWQFNDDALQFVRKYAGHVQRDGVLLHSCFGGNQRNYVMSASEDAHVYVWHKDSGGLLEVLEGHDAAVTDVAWNPVQPNLFASCSDDHTVRLWQPPIDEDNVLEEKWTDAGGSRNGPRASSIGLPAVPKSPTGIDVDMIIA